MNRLYNTKYSDLSYGDSICLKRESSSNLELPPQLFVWTNKQSTVSLIFRSDMGRALGGRSTSQETCRNLEFRFFGV